MRPGLLSLVKDLYPICRSISGEGVRKTLQRISEEIPLNIIEVPSGTKCFDWSIPLEWNIKDAYIKEPSGEKIVDFKKSNLHVVSYSVPFKGELSLQDLTPHLYSLADRPDAIPYVTSYYEKQWGFCLSHRTLQSLKEGKYEVVMDTELKEGSVTLADLVIPGESNKEILLSTYVCHPSMVNNELSGPAIATFLAKYLLSLKRRRFTYRFVFVPETIGTIAYLSKHLAHLKERVMGGYVLTCLAGKGGFTYLQTRDEETLVNRLTKHVLKHSGYKYKIRSFLDRGSDERQYGWPGVDLPVGSLMRSSYHDFAAYHTSDDNLDNCSEDELFESFKLYKKCLEGFELNTIPLVTTICEPFLSKRGLYRSLSTRDYTENSKLLFNILGYCDGKQDLLALADRVERPLFEVSEIIERCKEHGIIVEKDDHQRTQNLSNRAWASA